MRRAVCSVLLALLVGCAPSAPPPPHAAAERSPPSTPQKQKRTGRGTCDEALNLGPAAEVPLLDEYVKRELDADEQSLRAGRCSLHFATADGAEAPRFNGHLLPDLDDVSDCNELATKTQGVQRSMCRHACIVDARAAVAVLAAKRAWDGLVAIGKAARQGSAALRACVTKAPQVNESAPELVREVGRQLWECAGNAPLPRSFVVTLERSQLEEWPVVRVKGELPGVHASYTWQVHFVRYMCRDAGEWVLEQAPPWKDRGRASGRGPLIIE